MSMTTPEKPFDNTLWDPVDPEQTIEDPFHGSESVIHRLSTPPMPMPDGTYHVFGGFDVVGTCTFDANGKPFHKFTSATSIADMMRFPQMMEEWLEKVDRGELPVGYPETLNFFDLAAIPYFVIDRPEQPALDLPLLEIVVNEEEPQGQDKIQQARDFYKGIQPIEDED